jgi:hypothetical protein
MMRKLLFCILLLPGVIVAAGETKKDITLNEMFIRPGLFGLPRYAADPFTCDTTTKSAVYYNTALDTAYLCNGTSWGGLGGVSSPITGDFVATGKWTWGSAADAGESIRIGEGGASTGCIVFEGTTADGVETSLCPLDPTGGDQTYYLPNLAGAGASNLAGLSVPQTWLAENVFNNPVTFGTAAGAVNAITMQQSTAGSIQFEGGTADANETFLTATDPTGGDQEYRLPDYGNTITDTLAALQVPQTMVSKTVSPGATAAASGQYGINTASTPDIPGLQTGTTSNSIHIFEAGDVAYDFTNGPSGGSAAPDPILVIHSHNQAPDEWLTLSHNGTDGQIDVGTGTIELKDAFQVKGSGVGTPITFFVPKLASVTGADNLVIGGTSEAGTALSSGISNVFLGSNSGTTITTGNYNVGIGTNAFLNATNSISSNILIGFQVGSGIDGSSNICISTSGSKNSCADVDSNNLVIGNAALGGDTSNTMDNNVVLGILGGNELADDSDFNICIGAGTSTALNPCHSVSAASHERDYGLAIGSDADLSADHQAVFGGDTGYYDNFFFGSGSLDATPTSATLQATGGYGTDIAGASLTIAGGMGTGTGLGGDVISKVAPQSTTGSSQNTLVTQTQVVAKRFSLTDHTATTVLNVTAPADDSCMLTLSYTAKTKDASDIQSRAGIVHLLINEDPDAASYACSAEEQATVATSLVTGGTYTSAWTCVAGATTALKADLDSSLNTATTLQYTVINNSGCAISVP